MNASKWLIIAGRRYRLSSNNGWLWRLRWEYQRKKLNEPGLHELDYWRKKGVIKSEAEKEKEG